jgi:phage baseplate assembly protein W
MKDVRSIRSVNWQLQLDTFGGIVEDLDDINQCILTILTTPKGSDPLRPEFAMDVMAYVDKPMDVAIPTLVAQAVEALRLWEPRISLISLVASEPEIGHLNLQVTWTLVDGGPQFVTEVPV